MIEEEFKNYFESYMAKKKELEVKVASASSKWEEWKSSQSKNEANPRKG